MCKSSLKYNQCESYSKNVHHVSDENLPYGCIKKREKSGSVVIQFNHLNSAIAIPCGSSENATCLCLKEGIYNYMRNSPLFQGELVYEAR